jgi:hypothetical protein
VHSVRLGDETDRARAAAAGLLGRLTCLVAEVELGPAGSVKPNEIVEAVLGEAGVPHQAVRDSLLLAPATPMKPKLATEHQRDPHAAQSAMPLPMDVPN